MQSLFLREFIAQDFAWLQSWYLDPLLNDELGPLDEAWLAFVLSDTGGKQYSVFAGAEPMASIGVVWAKRAEKPHIVTDIAVNPMFRGQGLGGRALELLIQHTQQQNWLAYVSADNIRAQHFFSKNGWRQDQSLRVDDMFAYINKA
ncbi:GNAT family N-acetyltransferase [Bowmanella sp. Y26]|uniref:GNAT family N-acetyltransferase n=1 Tax=Bowmanella yangjiangensis TaxID=2811230 RepID=UPI001BDC57DB|nr:GNAT family N-acetyltransferase [Bowmanella yangjiangensis]MBT1063554.1 GNAT family N-acetyltransferase [Bowmanella yangjiangensis]